MPQDTTNNHAADYLQKLAERAHKVIFVYDVEANQFIYLNPFFEQVWQQASDQFLSDPGALIETVHPEDKAYVIKVYEDILHGIDQKDKNIEFRIQVDDHSERWVYLTPMLDTDEKGRRVIGGFVDDITERRVHHETLQKFTAKKNSVLEILSHDLARPLANIQGLSTRLAKQLESYENEQTHKMIEMITEASKQGVQLIRDFVHQEFLESAQADLIKKRIDLVNKLKQVIEQYQGSEYTISKSFHLYTDSEEVYLELDEVKFMQVINNLISNAIKFTTDKGVIIIRLEDQQDHVLITVEDNGIGIPAELQEGLFERFPKARRPGLKGEPSTGLGMSIIKTIVEWHNGKIWFESEENKGTIFYIEIPKE